MRYALSDGLGVEEQQGTVYLLPAWQSPIRLNRSASLLWHVIARSGSLSEAAAGLGQQEGVPSNQASALLEPFVRDLLAKAVLCELPEQL
jgi:hypothetical protein